MINLTEVRSIYFVGIGGIGMSAAAGLSQEAGFSVSGSDSKELYAPAKDVLDRYDIPYTVGYSREHIASQAADLYVLSSGEDLNNPEVAYIYEHNLPHVSFSELLYELNKEKLRIVVAGTHGKSTTAGLLGHVLKNIDDSSFMTGGVLKNYESNFHFGSGHYTVFEGDEYKAEWDDPTPKFHFYKPDILVLTNLEYDHPDVFGSFEAMLEEFGQLVEALPEDGLIVYNADDPVLAKLVHRSNVSSVSFGIDNEADYKAVGLAPDKEYMNLEVKNKFSKNLSAHLLQQSEGYKTQLRGKLNVYNALAAIATLRALGFQQEQLALELLSFQGIHRRFEIVGVKSGVTLVDDYAHHPTAVRETLAAARLHFPAARIWAVFEPHTFSRTEATVAELAGSFQDGDEVLVADIYPAREKYREGSITSGAVVEKINEERRKLPEAKPARWVRNKTEALAVLKQETKTGDIVIVMAVGDFNRLAYELKQLL